MTVTPSPKSPSSPGHVCLCGCFWGCCVRLLVRAWNDPGPSPCRSAFSHSLRVISFSPPADGAAAAVPGPRCGHEEPVPWTGPRCGTSVLPSSGRERAGPRGPCHCPVPNKTWWKLKTPSCLRFPLVKTKEPGLPVPAPPEPCPMSPSISQMLWVQ